MLMENHSSYPIWKCGKSKKIKTLRQAIPSNELHVFFNSRGYNPNLVQENTKYRNQN